MESQDLLAAPRISGAMKSNRPGQNIYGVSFPMTEKVSVKGDDTAPIYKWLVDQSKELAKSVQGTTSKDLVWKRYLQNPVDWNFTKFLLDENGKLIAVFHNKVSPMS